MIEIQLLVTNGKDEKRVFDHLVFTPKAFWKIDAFRIATGEKLVPGQTITFESEDCQDRQGKVSLTIEDYQGRPRNKVEYYVDPNAENPPPASAVKTAPVKAAPTKAAASPAPRPEPKSLAEEFGEEDEIPLQ